MNRFIKRLLLFSIVPCFFFIEGFIPEETFTIRPQEALSYKSKKGTAFPFYPDRELRMLAVGDLCHHTEFEIEKDIRWKTDKIGYRNDSFVNKADVLLIGDSFFIGTSLSQDSTFTNILREKSNLSVYNMAPAIFNDAITLIEEGVIQKPKVIVFEIIERKKPASLAAPKGKFHAANASFFSIFMDKVSRLYSFRFLKSRLMNVQGVGVNNNSNNDMFFLCGGNCTYHYDALDEIAQTIYSYQKVCDSLGIQFIFLPIPNKETVYYTQVPLEQQPDYLFKLSERLAKKGVSTIQSLTFLNKAVQHSDQYYYHLDDTHWNVAGVRLIADEVNKVIHQKLN